MKERDEESYWGGYYQGWKDGAEGNLKEILRLLEDIILHLKNAHFSFEQLLQREKEREKLLHYRLLRGELGKEMKK